MRPRAGHTLVELVVVLPVALLIAALGMASVVAQARLSRHVGEQSSRAEAERVVAAVLPAELRWASDADLRTDGNDSVRARIFRGFAVPVPCSAGMAFEWSGMRAPATAKDSLLVISGAGEVVLPLVAASTLPGCGYALESTGPLPPGVVLVFETGTYYLQDRALRYRTGMEGRQPLTDEWFVDAGSFLLRSPAGALTALQIAVRAGASGGAPETRRVQWALPNYPGDRP